ncbi:lipopolysaccharide biosynthesis protein [Garciella nitratireducens]|uniref:Membrane protein involved in the export of O-antigen and teichoic acid n=1 Tax=Garciella nitratireducens DSM 15102 TaxID=1121911 RepID=A0A1T4LSF4_9FIRM|nr:oligosaccharide flippase family protein [Garciella nitratireducens]SJZ57669.1 Membrane protein involved in the export of O-antigen and teichoic acid [Garciella nitratireducens DSM 15102]
MKEINNKLALKAGSWYIISNFAVKSISIITTPIFTRLLSTTDFGITNTYSSWLGIFTILGTLDIYSCVQIARHDYNDKEMDAFISSVLSVSSFSTILLYLIIKIFGDTAISFIGLPPILIDIMFLEILFSNAFTILQTRHRAEFKYKEFVILSAMIAILSPILSIVLVSLQNSHLYFGKILGNTIPKIIISIFIFIHIMKKGKCVYKKDYWKYALIISVPLIPHHLSGNILNHFDKIMINQYVSASDTGLYSLAYSYASVLSIAWTSFNQAWTPWFYGKMKEKNIQEIKRFAKPYTIAFSGIFIGMLFLGPEAIKFFAPKEYWGAKWVVPPVLLGLFFQFVYSLYVNVEFYYKKTQFIAIGTVMAAILNIVLNYIFIPRYGYLAASYTTLAGYIAIFVFHYPISKKWDKRDLYGEKFIFSWIFLMIGVTITATIFYNTLFVRIVLLLAVFGILLIRNKNQLLEMIRSLRKK